MQQESKLEILRYSINILYSYCNETLLVDTIEPISQAFFRYSTRTVLARISLNYHHEKCILEISSQNPFRVYHPHENINLVRS